MASLFFPSPLHSRRLSSFLPSRHPQQHQFPSSRSLKAPRLALLNLLHQARNHYPHRKNARLARHYYSRRSLLSSPPQHKTFPQVTPKTSSLCQAQTRSRISRAAVCCCPPSPCLVANPMAHCVCNGKRALAIWPCPALIPPLSAPGSPGASGGGLGEHCQTYQQTPHRRSHNFADLEFLIRPLRRSRRGLGTDYPNPGVHPYPHPAYDSTSPFNDAPLSRDHHRPPQAGGVVVT